MGENVRLLIDNRKRNNLSFIGIPEEEEFKKMGKVAHRRNNDWEFFDIWSKASAQIYKPERVLKQQEKKNKNPISTHLVIKKWQNQKTKPDT